MSSRRGGPAHLKHRIALVAAAIATVIAGFAGACAPAQKPPTTSVLLHVNSTCEAMASKTGQTWSVRMTRSGSRCGLRMGAASYRYGLPVGSISSRLDRDFALHAYGTDKCTRVFWNGVQYKWMATWDYCRA